MKVRLPPPCLLPLPLHLRTSPHSFSISLVSISTESFVSEEGGGDDSSVLTDGSMSGYHPHKIPRTQRGDTSRSRSPPAEVTTTPHTLATQPPVMRGRKKSTEREIHAGTSPSSSSRYLSHTAAPSSGTIPRPTTRIPRSQRSLSPQPSPASNSSPPRQQLDSLGTHSFVPSNRSASTLSPRHRSPSTRSPSRSLSPTPHAAAPQMKSKLRSSSAQISPPRTTSRAVPRTPTSTAKSKSIGGMKSPKDRTPISRRSRLQEEDEETPPRPFASVSAALTEKIIDKETTGGTAGAPPPGAAAAIDITPSLLFQSEQYVLSLLVLCGHIKSLLSQYRCQECISVCQLLPRRHFSSGWVQQMIGRAYFELNDYKVAPLPLPPPPHSPPPLR
jgi:hypothetical protein